MKLRTRIRTSSTSGGSVKSMAMEVLLLRDDDRSRVAPGKRPAMVHNPATREIVMGTPRYVIFWAPGRDGRR
jgi:hypothetical protein